MRCEPRHVALCRGPHTQDFDGFPAAVHIALHLTAARQESAGYCFEQCRQHLIPTPGVHAGMQRTHLCPRLVSPLAAKNALLNRSSEPDTTARAPFLACVHRQPDCCTRGVHIQTLLHQRRGWVRTCTAATSTAWLPATRGVSVTGLPRAWLKAVSCALSTAMACK